MSSVLEAALAGRDRPAYAATAREQMAATVTALLAEDPRAALVYAEISGQYVRRAAARHPERVVNVGIREQLLVSVAGGMALAGMRPVVHTFAPFLVERAFEQLKLDLAHQGVGAVLVSTGGSFDLPAAGRTHQAPGDVALMDTLPGVHVHAPGGPAETDAVLRRAVAGDELHYVRLTDRAGRVDDPRALERLRVLRSGRGPVVVALGPVVDDAFAAAAGTDAMVLHATTVRPFDVAGLREATADRAVADVVLVEPWLAGTSAHAVAAALGDRPHTLRSVGVRREAELRRYGTREQHAAAHGLDAAGIRRAIDAAADAATRRARGPARLGWGPPGGRPGRPR